MKKALAILLFLGLGLGCTRKYSLNDADDISLSRLYLSGKLKVGIEIPYQPIAFIEKGEYTGFDVDVINEVCTVLNLEPEYVEIDWDQKDTLLNNGDIDVIASGFSKTPEREELYGMTVPLLQNVLCIVVRINEERFTDFNSLNGARLGYQRDTTADEYVQAHISDDFQVTGTGFDNIIQALASLQSATIDAVLGDILVISYLISEQGRNNLKILPTALDRDHYVYAFRKEDKALITEFDAVLKQLANDDILSTITKKWFTNDISLLR